MRVLKKKFRKISKIAKPINGKPILKPIKIKPKLGKWCDCYAGRLPYPLECQGNKQSPISYLFKDGKKTMMYNRSMCVDCVRIVEFRSWKGGLWDKIKEAIKLGEDLRDMDPPIMRLK